MKKLVLLSLSVCFLFSVTTQACVKDIEIGKEKTEKVLFEAVVVSDANVEISKNVIFVTDSFVQRYSSVVENEAYLAFTYLEKESFKSSRYWHRNYDNPNSIFNNTSINKEYLEKPEKDRRV